MYSDGLCYTMPFVVSRSFTQGGTIVLQLRRRGGNRTHLSLLRRRQVRENEERRRADRERPYIVYLPAFSAEMLILCWMHGLPLPKIN